jgi:uncharacterized coiled-coil DUF342 family protein
MSDIQQFILSKLEKLDEKLDEVREHNASFKASFADHLRRDEEIHGEVIKLGDSIDRHSTLLDQYNQQLDEHMRRTEILENKVLPIVIKQEEEKTVEKWRDNKLKKSMKILGWLSALGGLVVIVLEIISKL